MDPHRSRGRADLASAGALELDSKAAARSNGTPALSVVMPVYNEGANIAATLGRLTAAIDAEPLEILIVYDFDEDDTVPVVGRLQATIPGLRLHRSHLGGGVLNAIKSGFAVARAPHILVSMADGSDEPTDVNRMLTVARSGADVVAGSRYMRGGRQIGGPLLKRTLSRVAGLSLHWLGGLPTHDATNNFKLYSRRLLDRVTIESTAGFELALELVVKAHLLGMRVEEVPTTWRDRSAGESKFRLWRWLPHYLRWYRQGLVGRFRRHPSPNA